MQPLKFRGKVNGDWMRVEFDPQHLATWLYFWQRVDPATVCQFTGKFDEHGVDIYEKDVLGLDGSQDRSRGHVVFAEQGFKVQLAMNAAIYDRDATWSCWIVIGNSVDNPELLVTQDEREE